MNIVLLVFLNLVLITMLLYGWMFWPSKTSCCSPCTCPVPDPCRVLLASGILSAEQILSLATAPPIVLPAVRGKIIQYVAGTVRFIPGTVAYTEPVSIAVLISYIPTSNFLDLANFVAWNNEYAVLGLPLLASPTTVTLNMRQTQTYTGNPSSKPLYLSIASDGVDPTDGNGTLQYYIYYTLEDPL